MPVMTEYAHGQFSWIDFTAHDADTAAKFYCDLFGWSVEKQDTQGGPPYWIFKSRGHEVAGLGQMDDAMKAMGIPPTWNNYLNVDDCMAAEQQCANLGATVVVPTMKVLDAGSLAFLTDPTGAMLGLWQADKHIGAGLVNDPGSWSWNELATRDLAKAKEFYAAAFGWTYEANEASPTEYFIAYNGGDMAAGLMQMTADWPSEVPPYWSVYFTVANADAATERLQSLGGTVIASPFDIPIGRIGVMCDAQGGGFNLFQPAG